MIPPEPRMSRQLGRQFELEVQEQESSCSVSRPRETEQRSSVRANCHCTCRYHGHNHLHRLVPVRARVTGHRRRYRGTLLTSARRHSAVDQPPTVPDDEHPALPGRLYAAESATPAECDKLSTEQSEVAASPSCITIPFDPRTWTRDDVHSWLRQMSLQLNMADDDIKPERFLMNGKALCLMNRSMFLYRVPRGGERLFTDFQQRLFRALLAPS